MGVATKQLTANQRIGLSVFLKESRVHKDKLINIYKQGGQELMVTVEIAEYRQEAVCWHR